MAASFIRHGSRYVPQLVVHVCVTYGGSPGTDYPEPAANPNDLTAIPTGPAGEQQGSRGHKRKQTLLSLLDALAELSKDEGLDELGELSFM